MSAEKQQEQLWNACRVCSTQMKTSCSKTVETAIKTVEIAMKRMSQTKPMRIAINWTKVTN